MPFRLHLVCPVCNQTSQHISDSRAGPRLRCGACLMERVQIVELTVESVESTDAAAVVHGRTFSHFNKAERIR